MGRALLPLLLIPGFFAPLLNADCPCVIRFGVCDEVRQSDVVFIGTAESVAPPFLDPYAGAKAMASFPAGETARLSMDASPDAIEKLKKIYLAMFSGVPESVKEQIVRANTQHDLQTAFDAVQSEGRVARFRVRTLFKQADDDDRAKNKARLPKRDKDKNDKDAKDKDDDPPPRFLEVWTGSGDCGIDFQVGETYLVYALEDEASGRLETSVCMRTRRLSEEQGDLAYLHFVQNDEEHSGRIEGFVSSSINDQNVPRYEDSISTPKGGALVELDTGASQRYLTTASDGRFAFDGLDKSDYQLSLLAPGFPRSPRTILLSRRIHAEPGACVRPILISPREYVPR